MMSIIVDVPPKLGEYMLKGWVLTDDICQTCRKVPLMRSPAAYDTVSYFCAGCDTQNGAENNTSPSPVLSASSGSNSILGSVSHVSRPSTPPTEVSSAFSSPVFAPVDTDEVLRRRQQSDRASVEIGKRMLRGWAMLADECPNQDCYGIPLIRPPKAGGEKDPRKECVICHTVFVDDQSGRGLVRLESNLHDGTPIPGPSRQLYSSEADTVAMASSSSVPTREPLETMGPTNPPPLNPQGIGRSVTQTDPLASATTITTPGTTTLAALELSTSALESCLKTLAGRLNLLSQAPICDPTSIAQTADAIGKVSYALQQVKQLQWSEVNASTV